jgi:hypothetical protein
MRKTKSNNPPDLIIEMDFKLAEFVIKNCDSNISFALGMLQQVSVNTAEALFKRRKNDNS